MASKASACDYLNNIHSSDHDLNFMEFIQLFDIMNASDIETLIIHAISYKNMNIMNALFDESNGFTHHLHDVFAIHINSLYSTDCTSLIPIIKTGNNIPSNLFSETSISQSHKITFDQTIIHPKKCILCKQILNHLLRTNVHIKSDINSKAVRISDSDMSIALKPHYLTYFDHCMFLGHYSMALRILQMDGWHSFIHGNFMLFLRDKMMKEMEKLSNYANNIKYEKNTFRINELPNYLQIVCKLYAMGADVDNVYKNHVLKGFAYFYDVIAQGNEIFESRQIALAKILQRCIVMMDFDVCFIIVTFVPFIDAKMIKKLANQKGMILKLK